MDANGDSLEEGQEGGDYSHASDFISLSNFEIL